MHDVKQFRSDKILKHLDRISSWLKGENPYPITAELDMTNCCNHRCPECVVSYYQRRDSSSLSTALASSIICQLSEAGVRGLIFTGGGEPLCSPSTPQMVAFAKNCGLDVGFITNGELLTERAAETLIANCTWLRVSLDADNPKTFGHTHGVGSSSFVRVIENIELLVKVNNKLASECTIGVGYLVDEISKKGMQKATVLCKNLGADYIQFRPMQIRRGEKFEYVWESIDDKLENCLNLRTSTFHVLFSKHKYEMMKRRDFGRNYGKCHGHQFATVIAANCKVYLCCHLRGYDKYCIGDLNYHSFSQIWHSQRRREVYENIDFTDCIPLCRCNPFNQILWDITQPAEHVNFL